MLLGAHKSATPLATSHDHLTITTAVFNLIQFFESFEVSGSKETEIKAKNLHSSYSTQAILPDDHQEFLSIMAVDRQH